MYNTYGQLGNGTTTVTNTLPMQVASLVVATLGGQSDAEHSLLVGAVPHKH